MDGEESSDRGVPTPPLSEQYHKARKQYALFSGLLLAWTLIGIKFVGERPGEPLAVKIGFIENVKITLSTPEVTPFIFAILILYFCYRTTVEWYQCDERRRLAPPSKTDFRIAHTLGGISVVLFVFQGYLSIEFGKLLETIGKPLLLSPLFSVLWVLIKTYAKGAIRIFVRNEPGMSMGPRLRVGFASLMIVVILPATVAIVIFYSLFREGAFTPSMGFSLLAAITLGILLANKFRRPMEEYILSALGRPWTNR